MRRGHLRKKREGREVEVGVLLLLLLLPLFLSLTSSSGFQRKVFCDSIVGSALFSSAYIGIMKHSVHTYIDV